LNQKITPDRVSASARFKHRRREKEAVAAAEAEAFARSALAEAREHSALVAGGRSGGLGERRIPVLTATSPPKVSSRKESWYMTHRGEWRVENEVLAYESRNDNENEGAKAMPLLSGSVDDNDIHESGVSQKELQNNMETFSSARKGRNGSGSPTAKVSPDCFLPKDMEERGVA
jgi:hypothetical protein